MMISRKNPFSKHPQWQPLVVSPRPRIIAQLLLLAVLLALAGCGNKGDLVLPSKTPPVHG